jgi:hypothetical protein
MRFTETTKPDRKSGGSRGTCGAPRLPHEGLGFVSSHTDSAGLGINPKMICLPRPAVRVPEPRHLFDSIYHPHFEWTAEHFELNHSPTPT